METWGAALYGNPCRDCGYDWGVSPDDAVTIVRDLPERYAAILARASGHERCPELAWGVTEYVCHVADNLRIWAERLTGARLSGERRVSGYDPDALALARAYGTATLPGALWSLGHSTRMWVEAMEAGLEAGTVLDHATRGAQRAEDLARNNSHDAVHHAWDLQRILGSA